MSSPRLITHLPDPKPLSLRERAVLVKAGTGATTAEIAEELGITSNTVSNHLSSAYDKLGARNSREAFWKAIKEGLL